MHMVTVIAASLWLLPVFFGVLSFLGEFGLPVGKVSALGF